MSHRLFNIILFFCTIVFSKTEITWQNPLPQGNRLHDVWVVGHDTAFAVGDRGTIIRTINKGATWEMMESKVRYHLLSVSFTDALHGCVAGYADAILMTSDGGTTWEKRESGTQDTLHTQFFLNSKFGWITGYHDNLLRTSDSGKTWELITFDNENIGRYANYLFFTDSVNGLGISIHVVRTYDGGKTWVDQGDGPALNDLIFVDPANGWSACFGALGRTRDSAKTWVSEYDAGATLYSISMLDTSYGWAAGTRNTIVHTSTGSAGWYRYKSPIPPDSSIYIHYNGVHFYDRKHGYIAGSWGNILKVSDNGNELEINSSRFHKNICGFFDYIYGVFAVDSLFCYVAGCFRHYEEDTVWSASIARTKDGGMNWEECLYGKRLGVDSSLYCLYFINRDKGWVAGAKGQILKTKDGGDNWEVTKSNTSIYIYDILFVDSQTGFACGDSGIYLRTTDGGENWQTYKMGNYRFNSLSFPCKDTGYMTTNSRVYKTVNCGIKWDTLISQPPAVKYDAFFVDSRNGFICSDNGLVFRTTNGGESWEQTNSNKVTNFPLCGFHAVNKDTVYATSACGLIIKTEDSGETWRVLVNSHCEPTLYSIHFSDSRHGWTVGESGTIMKITEKEQVVGIKKKALTLTKTRPKVLKLNVSSQGLQVHFTISSIAQINITLFNIRGRIVLNNAYEAFPKGKHLINIPLTGIPGGVYVVKILNGICGTEAKKVLIIK